MTQEEQVGPPAKRQWMRWLLLVPMGAGLFLGVLAGPAWKAQPSQRQVVTEELNANERSDLVKGLLEEGDRYVEKKNYNLANAAYESVFLLEPNHGEASDRIDWLKKRMLREGRSEAELITRVYDAEIEARVKRYLEEAKQLVAEGRLAQARFTLEKLLLINPLNEEARNLYQELAGRESKKTQAL